MAISFAGGTNRVSFGPALPNLPTGGIGTVSFWIKTTQTTANTSIIRHWNNSSRNGWAALMNSATAGKIRLIAYPTSTPTSVDIQSATTINDGSWHHIVFLLDGTSSNTNYIYIDGSLDASVAATAAWSSGSTIYLGVGDDYDTFWPSYNGHACEVAYWNDVHLNSAEISALAKWFSPKYIRPTSLGFYSPMIRDTRPLVMEDTAILANTGTTVSDHIRRL